MQLVSALYEAIGSYHYLLLFWCSLWWSTSISMVQEGLFVLRRKLWLSHITNTSPCFNPHCYSCYPFLQTYNSAGPVLWWGISHRSRVGLCPDLWELRTVSSLILQCYGNTLKNLLLINFSDIVFLFLPNKQGNRNKANLLTLHVLVLVCYFYRKYFCTTWVQFYIAINVKHLTVK